MYYVSCKLLMYKVIYKQRSSCPSLPKKAVGLMDRLDVVPGMRAEVRWVSGLTVKTDPRSDKSDGRYWIGQTCSQERKLRWTGEIGQMEELRQAIHSLRKVEVRSARLGWKTCTGQAFCRRRGTGVRWKNL